MKFAGQEDFSQGQTDLWNKITDLEFIAGIIPDLERVEHVDSDQLICRVKPQFTFLRGTLQLTFDFLEREPPDHLKISVRGKKIGASLTMEIKITFTQTDQASRLCWEGEILKRTGLLKPLGASLVQGAAENIIVKMWSDFRQALAAENKSA